MKHLLLLALMVAAQAAWAERFYKQMELQGVTFQVESANGDPPNEVRVHAAMPHKVRRSARWETDGKVTGAELGDLNADGFPEVYVFVTASGSGGYQSLIAYSSNKNKSISPIYLPKLEPELARGYMGHDRFAVGEGRLLRQFPIYRPGDTNAQPSGGVRQIQYRLDAGEAGWRLTVDRSFEMPEVTLPTRPPTTPSAKR